MDNYTESNTGFPSIEQLEAELNRKKKHKRFSHYIRKTLFILLCITALLFFTASAASPVLRVTGTSMQPTLNNGDIVILIKTDDLKIGDLCAFEYNDKLLIKRIIGMPGDEIKIDENGVFKINGKEFDDVDGIVKAGGYIDIQLPYRVAENSYFVVGDNRTESIDSRYFGSIDSDNILGKVVVQIWPLTNIKLFK